MCMAWYINPCLSADGGKTQLQIQVPHRYHQQAWSWEFCTTHAWPLNAGLSIQCLIVHKRMLWRTRNLHNSRIDSWIIRYAQAISMSMWKTNKKVEVHSGRAEKRLHMLPVAKSYVQDLNGFAGHLKCSVWGWCHLSRHHNEWLLFQASMATLDGQGKGKGKAMHHSMYCLLATNARNETSLATRVPLNAWWAATHQASENTLAILISCFTYLPTRVKHAVSHFCSQVWIWLLCLNTNISQCVRDARWIAPAPLQGGKQAGPSCAQLKEWSLISIACSHLNGVFILNSRNETT